MIVLPFPFILAEIALFIFFCTRFGFGPVFLAYVIPSFIGIFLLIVGGRTHTLTPSKLLGPLLLIPPFFASRVLGTLLILPGTRHLLLFFFPAWLFNRVAGMMNKAGAGAGAGFGAGQNANFRAYRFDGQGFRAAGFETSEESHLERDAKVIDVTPIEIEHSEKPSQSDSSIR